MLRKMAEKLVRSCDDHAALSEGLVVAGVECDGCQFKKHILPAMTQALQTADLTVSGFKVNSSHGFIDMSQTGQAGLLWAPCLEIS